VNHFLRTGKDGKDSKKVLLEPVNSGVAKIRAFDQWFELNWIVWDHNILHPVCNLQDYRLHTREGQMDESSAESSWREYIGDAAVKTIPDSFLGYEKITSSC
jgi:hypothetical protein